METIERDLTSRIHAVSVNGDDIWETMSLTDLDRPPEQLLASEEATEEESEPSDEDIFDGPDMVLIQFISLSYSFQTLQNY